MGRIPEATAIVESQLTYKDTQAFNLPGSRRKQAALRHKFRLVQRGGDPAPEWILSSLLEVHRWDQAPIHLKSLKCSRVCSCGPSADGSVIVREL